jgi:hypothetical protein
LGELIYVSSAFHEYGTRIGARDTVQTAIGATGTGAVGYNIVQLICFHPGIGEGRIGTQITEGTAEHGRHSPAFRNTLDYVNYDVPLLVAANLFEWQIEETRNILAPQLEIDKTFSVAFGEQFSNLYEIMFQTTCTVVTIFDVLLSHALNDRAKYVWNVHSLG